MNEGPNGNSTSSYAFVLSEDLMNFGTPVRLSGGSQHNYLIINSNFFIKSLAHLKKRYSLNTFLNTKKQKRQLHLCNCLNISSPSWT